jgi:hypothetical protein
VVRPSSSIGGRVERDELDAAARLERELRAAQDVDRGGCGHGRLA